MNFQNRNNCPDTFVEGSLVFHRKHLKSTYQRNEMKIVTSYANPDLEWAAGNLIWSNGYICEPHKKQDLMEKAGGFRTALGAWSVGLHNVQKYQ